MTLFPAINERMGKTPKSKNVNYRSKSHLQPKVAQHRPKNNGAEKLSFPGKSDQCAPTKRRMNLSSSLARKASQHKSFSIKVSAPSSSAENKELAQTRNMSMVTAEVAETINSEPPSVILENGKEDSQEKEEENDTKDVQSMSNCSESESVKPLKSDIIDNGDTTRKLIQDGNSVQESAIDGEGCTASKLSKDDDGDRKKQRSGTPQSRSSTPQRKSERVRSKQGSPNKTSPNFSPALKILKINLTPCKSSTNGTSSTEKTSNFAVEDSVKPKDSKNKEVETQEKMEATEKHDKVCLDVHDVKEGGNECITMDPETPKPTEGSPTYLRSLRLISGRRSLSSKSSPFNSLSTSSTYEMNPGTPSQWKKRQTLRRMKDGIMLKDDSESDYQDTENQLNTSTISGKRKAERLDDQPIKLAECSLKKPKSEDDALRLFINDDEDEEKLFLEKDSGEKEYIDDHLKSSASKQNNSTDYGDDMAEFKDLPEKDESFIIDESMDFAYEASEVEGYVKTEDSSVASNQSSNKSWCILM